MKEKSDLTHTRKQGPNRSAPLEFRMDISWSLVSG